MRKHSVRLPTFFASPLHSSSLRVRVFVFLAAALLGTTLSAGSARANDPRLWDQRCYGWYQYLSASIRNSPAFYHNLNGWKHCLVSYHGRSILRSIEALENGGGDGGGGVDPPPPPPDDWDDENF